MAAAAAVRSSVELALRRATAPASSRLPSAGAASATSRVVRISPSSILHAITRQGARRQYGHYDSSRSMFDAEAYSAGKAAVPSNPEMDKFDCLFSAAAMIGTFVLAWHMDGEGLGTHYFGWTGKEKTTTSTSRQPRMTTTGRRR